MFKWIYCMHACGDCLCVSSVRGNQCLGGSRLWPLFRPGAPRGSSLQSVGAIEPQLLLSQSGPQGNLAQEPEQGTSGKDGSRCVKPCDQCVTLGDCDTTLLLAQTPVDSAVNAEIRETVSVCVLLNYSSYGAW